MSVAKVFQCKGCGGTMEIRAPGVSMSVVCKSCGSVSDPNDENFKIIGNVANKKRILPTIPIGSRGKMHGFDWECIGFMSRCDQSNIYCWMEYLLFNPQKGFRWLTEFDGHWNYVITTKQKPKSGYGDTAEYLGNTYKIFHVGRANVRYVEGEFYWQVEAGNTVVVRDFIRPPEVLSEEKDKNEVIWSVGNYTSPADVSRAFGIGSLPPGKRRCSESAFNDVGTLGRDRKLLRHIRFNFNLPAAFARRVF